MPVAPQLLATSPIEAGSNVQHDKPAFLGVDITHPEVRDFALRETHHGERLLLMFRETVGPCAGGSCMGVFGKVLGLTVVLHFMPFFIESLFSLYALQNTCAEFISWSTWGVALSITLPCVVGHLFYELRCLRYSVLPFIQAVQRFSILTIPVPSTIWFTYQFACSMLYLINLITTSMYAANFVTVGWSASCAGHRKFPNYLVWLALLLWSLTGIKLLFVYVAFFLHRRRQMKPLWNQVGRHDAVHDDYFKNYCNWSIDVGEAFQVLAEAFGMSTIQAMAIPFRESRGALISEDKIPQRWELDGRTAPERALDHFHICISLMTFRIIFIGIFRVALPVIMQVERFALLTKEEASLRARLSICVGFCCAVPVLLSTCLFVCKWKTLREQVSKSILLHRQLSTRRPNGFMCAQLKIFISALAFMLLMAYSLTKFIRTMIA